MHRFGALAMNSACAASPLNGRAAIAHWDRICENDDIGRMAWLLNADTLQAQRYGKRMGVLT